MFRTRFALLSPLILLACEGPDYDIYAACNTALGDTTWYSDDDLDGYGDDEQTLTTTACRDACDSTYEEGDVLDVGEGCLEGYVIAYGDCEDTLPSINPAATEICDSIDNDCDGRLDDDDDLVETEGVDDGAANYYADDDGDGHGAGAPERWCEGPEGRVADATDCDDDDPSVNPDADETCNGVDDDCDGEVDDGLRAYTWYLDQDGDEYGDSDFPSVELCLEQRPVGYVEDSGDCDDLDETVNPAAQEICNSVDDDCDGDEDEDLTYTTWYDDDDGDGFGDANDAGSNTCDETLAGHVDGDTDCDDADATVNPDASETCNDIDDDCDDDIDEEVRLTVYQDGDGDGFGDASTATDACSVASGWSLDADDCDDATASTYPGATEVCDGVDQDCDLVADDGVATSTWYADADGDGYGDADVSTEDCAAPSGYLADDTDCDDADADVYPGAYDEPNDGYDWNCDTLEGEDDYVSTSLTYGEMDVLLEGASAGDTLGNSVGYVGDVDGDGNDDVLVAALAADPGGLASAGTGYLFYGPLSSGITVASADAWIEGGAAGDQAGVSAGPVGDLDGDGMLDVVVVSPGYDVSASLTDAGALLFFSGGPAAGGSVTTDADAILYGTDSGDYLAAVTTATDYDAVGTPAILVGGVYAEDGSHTNAGVVYLVHGADVAAGGDIDSAYTYRWYGDNNAGENAGRSLCVLDADADGVRGEFATGANGRNTNGGVFVVDIRAAGGGSLESASVVLTGDSGDALGGEVVCPGDVDTDGYDDLLVNGGETASGEGEAFLVDTDGLTSGTLSTQPSVARFIGEYTREASGFAQSLSAGDWDADGNTDVAIGAGEDAAGAAGTVYLLLGPFTPGATYYVGTDAAWSVSGSAGDRLGIQVDLGGDVNGDGYDDLMVAGDLYDGAAGASTGAVGWLLGGPW